MKTKTFIFLIAALFLATDAAANHGVEREDCPMATVSPYDQQSADEAFLAFQFYTGMETITYHDSWSPWYVVIIGHTINGMPHYYAGLSMDGYYPATSKAMGMFFLRENIFNGVGDP